MDDLPTIVTVLRSGGDFTPDHVRFFKRQLDKVENLLPYPFVCLSDTPIDGIKTVPIERNWPGWWSKVELFDHFDNALYFDLDTVLLDRIDLLAWLPTGFHALRKVSGDKSGFGSGVMRWKGDYSDVARALTTERMYGGDQDYIAEQVGSYTHLQTLFPNWIVSYKNDLQRGAVRPTADNRIVCFHGQPRPWDVEEDWI